MKHLFFVMSLMIISINFLPPSFLQSAENTAEESTNNDYAFAVFRTLLEDASDTNSVFSPHSVREILRLAYLGAAGDTAKELDTLFHYSMEQTLKPGQELSYTVLSGIWVQKKYTMERNYIEAVKRWHGHVEIVDFTQGKETEAIINEWFSDSTKGLISSVVADMPTATQLVLGNAVYFKGQWDYPFDKNLSDTKPFYPESGDVINAEMMRQVSTFSYAKGNSYSVVELPYLENDLSLFIFLPEKGISLKDFSKTFTESFFSDSIASSAKKEVSLTLPKFGISQTVDVIPLLEKNGISKAFSDKADFSKMTHLRDIKIDSIQHRALIEVDEAGTEAAAASAAVMSVTSLPSPQNLPIRFIADHPFIYVLYDRQNKMVLFIGSVVKPE